MYGSMRYLYSMVSKPNYKQIIINQSYSIWLCIIKKKGLVQIYHCICNGHVRGHLSLSEQCEIRVSSR
jgi:hypothetical protein